MSKCAVHFQFRPEDKTVDRAVCNDYATFINVKRQKGEQQPAKSLSAGTKSSRIRAVAVPHDRTETGAVCHEMKRYFSEGVWSLKFRTGCGAGRRSWRNLALRSASR